MPTWQARWQRNFFLLFHLNKPERVITPSLKPGQGDKEERENSIRETQSFVSWRSSVFFQKPPLVEIRGAAACAVIDIPPTSWFMHKYACVCVCLWYLWYTFPVVLRCEMLRRGCRAERIGFGAVRESERKLHLHFLTIADRVLWSTNCISYTMLVATAEKIHRRSHR